MIKTALLVLALVACGGSSAPAPHDPADKPPLPPASGTPIGYLIDGASDLHLRDDQVAKLRDIDTSLASELETIDTRLRGATAKPEDSSPPPQQMGGRGGRHGGRGGGHHRGGGGAGSAAPHGDPAAADRLTEERREDVKSALERAFAVLDADQQPAAKKLLEDHDVDLEDGRPPAAEDPSEQPTEPGEQ